MKFDKLPSGATVFAQELNALRADARGGSLLLAHQQLGALALPTNPTNGETISLDINGTTVVLTGKTGSIANPGDFAIQATAAETAAVIAAALKNPITSTSTFIGFTGTQAASGVLIQYCGYALPSGGTTITVFSLNTSVASPLLTFSASTTVTGASWTAQTMQLYVEDGAYYVNGVRYFFTGGSTPTVTAPISNPRIDVLSIDTSGTLAWTTGTEAASPSAPSYPENKLPLCELYNVVGETALYDNDNQQSNQGYILNDVRPAITYGPNFAAIGEDLLPDATNTRSLGSSGEQWKNIYSENIFVGTNPVSVASFGGTGTDGALSISSGTTTIDLGGAAVVTKNYTSISITGTGKLAFSNPNTNGTLVNLKSQGNVTLTSSTTPMIDASGIGAQAPSNNGQGTECVVSAGGGSGTGGGSNPQGAGTAGAAIFYPLNIAGKKVRAMPGGAGGSGNGGGTGSNTSGGNGGGALIIECNGALDFTTANGISVAGKNGANGANGGNDQGGAGGGGGGAGGICAIIYRFLTANTGTITTTGGNGGTGGTAGINVGGLTSAGGGGGAGGGNLYTGGNGGNAGGTNGTNAANGSAGSGTGAGTGGTGGGGGANSKSAGGGGGGGAPGASYVVQNTEFS